MRYLQGRLPEGSLQGKSTEDTQEGHKQEKETLRL